MDNALNFDRCELNEDQLAAISGGRPAGLSAKALIAYYNKDYVQLFDLLTDFTKRGLLSSGDIDEFYQECRSSGLAVPYGLDGRLKMLRDHLQSIGQ